MIEGCIFKGSISTAGECGAIAGVLSNTCVVKNSASFTTEYPVCGNNSEAVVISSYAASEIVSYAPFTLDGVTYQRYNFGYLNATTGEFVSGGMTTDKEFEGYITMRDDADKHDVRIVFLTNLSMIKGLGETKVVITFTKGNETVKEYTLTFGGENNEFDAFRAGVAAGETYFAGEGCALFGAVINDIPDSAWDSISVEINKGTETLFDGGMDYAG